MIPTGIPAKESPGDLAWVDQPHAHRSPGRPPTGTPCTRWGLDQGPLGLASSINPCLAAEVNGGCHV